MRGVVNHPMMRPQFKEGGGFSRRSHFRGVASSGLEVGVVDQRLRVQGKKSVRVFFVDRCPGKLASCRALGTSVH